MRCVIFANGEMSSGDWVLPIVQAAQMIVAADGGARHLYDRQIAPDAVVGDCDSLTPEIEAWLLHQHIPIHRFSAEKDETDLELALLHCVEHNATEIVILGALGGRIDQLLANFLLLAHTSLVGLPVFIVDGTQRAWLVRDSAEINGQFGDTISLIPIGGAVTVAQTSGLKWPLNNSKLIFGPARGVSNVLEAQKATIHLQSGTLLCIHIQQSK